jgi:hypothetical protein
MCLTDVAVRIFSIDYAVIKTPINLLPYSETVIGTSSMDAVVRVSDVLSKVYSLQFCEWKSSLHSLLRYTKSPPLMYRDHASCKICMHLLLCFANPAATSNDS